MTVRRIDHCTLIITDVAKARAFYGGLLGLKEIPAPKEFDFIAIWFDLGGQYLHLLLKPEPDTPSPRHICLLVDDVRTMRESYKARGIPIDETVKIAAADRFFVRDPFGNRIELLQWDRPYDPEQDGRYSA
jgi:catechol 2,3-dioxygenase-like lactoylglutathione lyase family enzyme